MAVPTNPLWLFFGGRVGLGSVSWCLKLQGSRPSGTNIGFGPFTNLIAVYLCVIPMDASLTPASLSAVQSRIDEIADQAGVEGSARLSVDDTLAALPWPFRRRLVLALQSLQAFSPDPGVQDAAEFFQLKAARVWAAMPFQGHSEEGAAETAVLVERGAGHRTVTRVKKP